MKNIQNVLFRVDEETIEEFDAKAERHGFTRSELLRRLMREFSRGDGDLDIGISEAVAMVKFQAELSAKRRKPSKGEKS